MMNRYLQDVASQAASLTEALKAYSSEAYAALWSGLRTSRFDRVLFTGMGSSHYCSLGAAIRLVNGGVHALVKSASDILHYEQALLSGNTLVVMISQSGESGEIVRLIESLPAETKVVAITNNPLSTLGRRGDYTLPLRVEEEVSVTTRTYLASFVLVHLLASVLMGEDVTATMLACKAGLGRLDRTLSDYELAIERIGDFLGSPKYLALIGRGYSMSSVLAGSLFIREVAKYPALPMESGEFRHGPFEMIDDSFRAVVFAPPGNGYESGKTLAKDIASRGGKVILLTSIGSGVDEPGILSLELAAGPEWLQPLVDIVPIQWIANRLAENQGLEVGVFRWASKITTIV